MRLAAEAAARPAPRPRALPALPRLAVVEVDRSPLGPCIVLDTNVLLSAVFARPGLCAAILRRAAAGEFRPVASPAIWDEVRRVLTGTYGVPPDDATTWIHVLGSPVETLSGPLTRVRQGGRALSDGARRTLETAVAARASYVVTGDPELLKLGFVQGVEILTPAAFLALHGE